MNTATSRMKPNGLLGTKGSVVWRDENMHYAPDPELCHCGAKALRRHGEAGFCKAHYDDAVAAAKKTNRRGEL